MRIGTAKTLAIAALAAATAGIGQAQTYKVLYSFAGGSGGWEPMATPFFADGNLYGTTQKGGTKGNGTFYEFNISSATLSVLGSFNDSFYYANTPADGLVRDATGHFYGVAGGGAGLSGVIYKVGNKNGKTTYSVVYSFNANLTNAAPAQGPLARDAASNFYGAVSDGAGGGLVYMLDHLGNFNVLHTFGGSGDGGNPVGGVLLENGALYGATQQGGSAGGGTVWGYDLASSSYSILWNFQGGADGDSPEGGVVSDGAGNLYGTTRGGGIVNSRGPGIVYQINIAGKTEKILSVMKQGYFPEGTLVRDPHGNLYGTTSGPPSTIFKVTPAGKLSTLYSFDQSGSGKTVTGLTRDGAGNLYGVTINSGSTACKQGCGEIFELTP